MLISIPFLTMMERKALGYSQLRKGPNKVRIIGLLQPITDGGKLVLKEFGSPRLSNIILL
jgi:NADH-ubiquinone oxidoreductase chain 1